jgi:hypothetical protein
LICLFALQREIAAHNEHTMQLLSVERNNIEQQRLNAVAGPVCEFVRRYSLVSFVQLN